jgi:hypothetical protein
MRCATYCADEQASSAIYGSYSASSSNIRLWEKRLLYLLTRSVSWDLAHMCTGP